MPEKFTEQTFKTPQNSIIRIKTMDKGFPDGLVSKTLP